MNSGRPKKRFRDSVGKKLGIASLAMLLAATGAVLIGSGPVTAAAGDPTFETPTGNPGTQGSVGFFNASGVQIYGGTVSDDPIAAYFQTSGGGIKAGDHIATAYSYTPQDNKPADQWTTPTQLTAGDESGTVASSAGYPGALHNSTKFIAVGVGGGTSINDSLAAFPLASTNDPGILQIRILTNGDASKYYSTDIKITGTGWAQVFPAPPGVPDKTTSTTLTATPNPSTLGQSVTLSAVETASDNSHPAGSVQFKDGASNLGSPVAVNGAGTATTATIALTLGSHSITAVFTPTPTGFVGSTSSPVSQVVNPIPVATPTTTALTLSPASPVITPAVTTLSAQVSPAGAVGTVQFLDGATNLGSPITVSAGAAQSTATLTVGTHSLTAKFIPTDPSAFATSVSAASSYRVDPVPAQGTTTILTVSPTGPVVAGNDVTITATVNPATAPGAFQFYDGATPIGLPAGSSLAGAELITSSLSVGTHQLSAKFIPTTPTDFGSSTSNVVSLVIKAAPIVTTTTVSITPAAKAVDSSAVTFKATLSPVGAVGTVQFAEDGAPVGSPVTVTGGIASLPATASGLGTHPVTATFTPADVSVYLGSSGSATLTVIAPPTPTTTSLQVAPAGPVDFGSAVTLTGSVPTAGAAGTVRFLDGTAVLGTVALAAGTATLTTSTLASGSHSLTASFVPADTDLFTGSTSTPASTLVVKAQPTSTALTATPGTLVTAGTSVSLKASLTPAGAAGSVQFLDGSTAIGTAAVKSGTATLATTDLSIADHVLTAVFTPADPSLFGGSTSAVVNLSVKAPATVGDITVDGKKVASGDTLQPGDRVTIAGAGFASTESIKVMLGSTLLDTVTASAAGDVTATVTLPTALSAGKHTLILRGSVDAPGFDFIIKAAAVSSSAAVPSAAAGSANPVAGASSSGGSSLASTGAVILPLLAGGLLLLLLGGLLISGSRRRAH